MKLRTSQGLFVIICENRNTSMKYFVIIGSGTMLPDSPIINVSIINKTIGDKIVVCGINTGF